MKHHHELNTLLHREYLRQYILRYKTHESVRAIPGGGIHVTGISPREFQDVIKYADQLNVEVSRDYPEHSIPA